MIKHWLKTTSLYIVKLNSTLSPQMYWISGVNLNMKSEEAR